MALIRKTDGRYFRITAINPNGGVSLEVYKDKAHRTEFKTRVPTVPQSPMGGIMDSEQDYLPMPKPRNAYLQNFEKKMKQTMGKVDQSIYDAQWALAYQLIKLAPELNGEEFTDDI